MHSNISPGGIVLGARSHTMLGDSRDEGPWKGGNLTAFLAVLAISHSCAPARTIVPNSPESIRYPSNDEELGLGSGVLG